MDVRSEISYACPWTMGTDFFGQEILYTLLHAGRHEDYPPWEIRGKITHGEKG